MKLTKTEKWFSVFKDIGQDWCEIYEINLFWIKMRDGSRTHIASGMEFHITLVNSWKPLIYDRRSFLLDDRNLRIQIFPYMTLYIVSSFRGKLNPIRPGLLDPKIPGRGRGGTENHTFESPLLIVKMLWNLVWVIFGIFPFV